MAGKEVLQKNIAYLHQELRAKEMTSTHQGEQRKGQTIKIFSWSMLYWMTIAEANN